MSALFGNLNFVRLPALNWTHRSPPNLSANPLVVCGLICVNAVYLGLLRADLRCWH